MSEVKSGDNNSDFKEPIIMYGLTEKKRKKNPDKFVKKFLDKLNPILENFIQKYNNADFTELTQFKSYKDEIKRYFV